MLHPNLLHVCIWIGRLVEFNKLIGRLVEFLYF